ncbi:methyltransferase domain-containing protein [Mesorhizobium sp.]|uniref:methyltransferase domain-containing protein n=1 Tax=Mesorhizobium sp. TaxID=1871066 RepID=UPI0012150C2E|nr:methyltransferase domain-containing protein [Mesorhizobium sp.]TIS50600.1 MAG: methyltransferase domain-containing protein [Mesorhizobium sp.]
MKKTFDDLYRAFEDRFRGSRELIKERLRIYLPLLAQVPKQGDKPNLAIDLGCGRGEWLEILAEAGLEAVGVDLNEGMAQEATDKGLRIELQDAIQYLRQQPDDSVAVISAFHMVEHVPTDYLIELLDECHRVVVDDGLLILETPNPENISVGTHTFHLDPTHKSPLPPSLLEFLVEQAGFAETAILRLNGAPMIEAGPIERSIHLMFEVARDYACLARKRDKQPAEEAELLGAFVQTESQQMPTDTGKIKEWLRSADNEMAQSELMRTGNIVLTDTVASLGKQVKELSKERDAEIARLSESFTTLVDQVQQLAALTDAIQNSTSWRITAPLRGLKRVISIATWWPGFRAVARVPKAKARLVMRHGLLWLRRRPRAAAFVQHVVRLVPPLERRLLAFARASVFVTVDSGWALEPDPVILDAWRERLKPGKST